MREKKKKTVKIRKIIEEEEALREVIVKIGLERIDIQKRIMVKILLNSSIRIMYVGLGLFFYFPPYFHFLFHLSLILKLRVRVSIMS